jgi:UDPglucose 6-dehydrogenase
MTSHRPGVHFEILSNPEFLAAGTAVNDLLFPDRVLIGSSTTALGKCAAEALASVYASWVPRSRIITTNLWSSELAKLVANSMLAQRISSINSISAICEKTGADIDEIALSIGNDPRIGDKFLKAGIGFGGSCFKKDILSLVYLAESLELQEVGEYWRQVVKMNEYQRDRFSQRVIKSLNNTLRGKKITILGYAFKKNTSDTRESPALEIIKKLLEEGPREIAIFDPCCNSKTIVEEIRMLLGQIHAVQQDGGPIRVCENPYDACNNSDAILITTEFDEFGKSKAPKLSQKNTSVQTESRLPGSKRIPDPRPFDGVGPSESDLLALHRFLIRDNIPGVPIASNDPLERFQPEPTCASDCVDCLLESEAKAVSSNASRTTIEYRRKERLDWAKISYHMRQPKWVFDGRGVLDVAEMQALGVRIETVGRQLRR